MIDASVAFVIMSFFAVAHMSNPTCVTTTIAELHEWAADVWASNSNVRFGS